MKATSSHSFLELMSKLCETAIQSRREYDHSVNDHLWNLKITPPQKSMSSPNRVAERFDYINDDDDDDGEQSGDEEGENSIFLACDPDPVMIYCPSEETINGEQEGGTETFDGFEFGQHVTKISSSQKLSVEVLSLGSIITITYDYGSTTTLYLKVLKAHHAAVQKLLQYFTLEVDDSKQQKELKAVPAYNLPKDQQVDAHFPHLSKIFLGKYVPILELKVKEDEDDKDKGSDKDDDCDVHGYCDSRIGSVCLGKYACRRSEKDTPFSYIQGHTMDEDVLFCPVVMDPNEFLQVANEAWTPRDPDDDPDKLDQYRFDGILRSLAPADDDEIYGKLQDVKNSAIFGPYRLIYRLNRDTITNKHAFDFQTVFPKTYAMLTNGKFRWFQYQKGILRIIVGRGIGPLDRNFESDQILKSWKRDFQSFHELLCAVEASWVWKGKELQADSVIPKYDTDLGASRPGPKKPFSLGKQNDCVLISRYSNLKKLVTALAITEEDGKSVLYSGHDDGTISKWCLDDNVQLWCKRLFVDATEENGRRSHSVWFVHQTMGVAGIAIRPLKNDKKKHCIYAWTHNYTGYPSTPAFRQPSKVYCLSSDFEVIRSYCCDVGCRVENDTPANPSIAAVVFCQLYMEDEERWVDSMVVGLHCATRSYNWEDDYSDYDLELAQNSGEGNILPFYEHTGTRMESWREGLELIKALAVIPRKYVLSLSIRMGTGFPDAMILWSCEEPGIPIHRHNFWNPRAQHILRNSTSRLEEVSGISVWGTDIIIADKASDRIAVVSVEDGDGEPDIQLHGYAKIGNNEEFHGRTAMAGQYSILANQSSQDVWMFKTQECWNHPKLDKEEGSLFTFVEREREMDDCDEDDPKKYAGRDIAVGHYSFPRWGGNRPTRKKRKNPDYMGGREVEDDEDGHGKGGPIVLAMRGKWLVAGFSNGTVARAPHLPSQFVHPERTVNANDLTSFSHISSCDWYSPDLEFEDTQ